MATAHMPDDFYDLVAHHLPPEQPVGPRGGRPRVGHRVVVRVIWFVLATGNRFHNCILRVGQSTTEYTDHVGIIISGGHRTEFIGGAIQAEDTQSHFPQLSNFSGGTMVRIGSSSNYVKFETILIDGDGFDDTKAFELTGTRLGIEIDCMVDGTTAFEAADERLIDADAATVREINARFVGNFTDALMVDPGASEAAGMKKLFDLASGWTGTITVVDVAADGGGAGSEITLTEGNAY